MGDPADTVREFLDRHYPDYGYRDGRFILAAPSGIAARRSFGQRLQRFLEQTHTGYDYEIRGGEYVLVSPHDFVSTTTCTRLSYFLNAGILPRNLGFVSDSNGGFEFDNGDVLAPDVAFISRERLPSSPEVFC